MKEEKDFSFKPYIIFAIIMFIIVISTYTINFYENTISKLPGDWWTFGDFMGGTLNPILAFLSFLALLQTIKIQSKELKNSTKELKETRKATRDSAEALKEQSNSIKIQNFENTFFNMISLHNEIINSLNIKPYTWFKLRYDKFGDSEDIIKRTESNQIGKDTITFFKNLLREFLNEFNTYSTKNEYSDIKYNLGEGTIEKPLNQNSRSNEFYLIFYENSSNYLEHYFRNIYQIIKFIDFSFIENKKFYINILRTQLTNDELEIFFYNAISDLGNEKLLPLLIKYSFFEHLIYSEEISIHDIKFCIEKTKELNPEYQNNKLFGTNKKWKEFIDSI